MDREAVEATILIVLGGDRDREIAAAQKVAKLQRCRLLILSSGAASEDDMQQAVRASGRHDVLVVVDRRAIDTVSNCTSLAPDLAGAGSVAVALSTARAHCRRAAAVGSLVFGAFGIRVRTMPVDTGERLHETLFRCIRDVLRAACWVTTGLDLSSVAALVHSQRAKDSRQWSQREGEASVTRLREALAQIRQRSS